MKLEDLDWEEISGYIDATHRAIIYCEDASITLYKDENCPSHYYVGLLGPTGYDDREWVNVDPLTAQAVLLRLLNRYP